MIVVNIDEADGVSM